MQTWKIIRILAKKDPDSNNTSIISIIYGFQRFYGLFQRRIGQAINDLLKRREMFTWRNINLIHTDGQYGSLDLQKISLRRLRSFDMINHIQYKEVA